MNLGRAEGIVSLLLFLFSGAYLGGALALPWGRIGQPGPGLFPGVIGLSAGILTAVHLLRFLRPTLPPEMGEPIPRGKGLRRVLGIFGALIFFAAFLQSGGYLAATFILVAAVLYFFEMKDWRAILFLAFLMAAGSYYLFTALLRVGLPQGIFPL